MTDHIKKALSCIKFLFIQDIQQLRLQCEQDMKQLETFATTGFIHSTRKESIRTQIR